MQKSHKNLSILFLKKGQICVFLNKWSYFYEKKILLAKRLGNFERQLNKDYFEKKNFKIGRVVSNKSLVKVEKFFDFI